MKGAKRGGLLAALLVALVPALTDAQAVEMGSNAEPLWTRECAKASSGSDACFVQQFVVALPQKTVLLRVMFSYLGKENRPHMQLTVPLGVVLPAGLKLAIDGQPSITIPLQVCHSGGCESTADIDAQALDQFRKGKIASVRYQTTEGEQDDLPVKLDGLAATLKAVAP